jgi:hypothetical protein
MSDNKKIRKIIKQKINLIKDSVFDEIFNSNFNFSNDTSFDITAENIFNQFEIELTDWIITNYNNKDLYSSFSEYLNNKYLATQFDSFPSTRKVKEYRKIIITILDSSFFN